MTPTFVNQCRFQKMPRAFLKRWLKELSTHLKQTHGQELVIVFVDPARMKAINLQFRGKGYATDVLSFGGVESLGELVLCPQILREQAKRTGLTYHQELGYMLIHGVLHLLGFDHEVNERDAKKMFLLQDKIFAAIK